MRVWGYRSCDIECSRSVARQSTQAQAGGVTWVRRATGSVEAGTTGQDPDPVRVGFQGVALWTGFILEFRFPGCQGLFSM